MSRASVGSRRTVLQLHIIPPLSCKSSTFSKLLQPREDDIQHQSQHEQGSEYHEDRGEDTRGGGGGARDDAGHVAGGIGAQGGRVARHGGGSGGLSDAVLR